MSDVCPKCGSPAVTEDLGVLYFDCGMYQHARGSYQGFAGDATARKECRIRQLEQQLAAAQAELDAFATSVGLLRSAFQPVVCELYKACGDPEHEHLKEYSRYNIELTVGEMRAIFKAMAASKNFVGERGA